MGLRALYVSSLALPHYGGMSRVFFEEFERLLKRGVEVKGLCERPEKGGLRPPSGIDLEYFRFNFSRIFTNDKY